MRPPYWLAMPAFGLLLTVAGCESGGASDPPEGQGSLEGHWRAVLTSPGGELPFGLEIGAPGVRPAATVINGSERVSVGRLIREGTRVTLHMDPYDAAVHAELSTNGEGMRGTWRKRTSSGVSSLPFLAVRNRTHRFSPPSTTARVVSDVTTVGGTWAATFEDPDGRFPARGELQQRGSTVTGTFLTATGDYRFLAGDFIGGVLRLSTFDGSHAFLFRAEAQADGSLRGDFWSRDSYHARWRAERASAKEAQEILPDPTREVRVVSADGRLRFSFPDLRGKQVSLSDFLGEVVLVDVFGTWCPNCNDQAPLLAGWQRKYRERGFTVIGLAYEYSGDPEVDRVQVGRWARSHGVDYPLLLAGTSDKDAASQTLPDLSEIRSFPTTLFVDRRGRVRRIHSGFAGPATGIHHRELVREFESEIERLVAEPSSP